MGDVQDAIKKSTKFNDGKPVANYKLTYDSQSTQLEPIYYWLLDFLEGMGIKTEKLVDNFMASPGSGQFAEMGQRVTRMQEEGMKIMGMTNQIVKTILNLIYDLKEFEIRLKHYAKARSDDPKEKEQGMLALKQIWLDNVDIKRGKGSIHSMASMEMGFSTVREIFMIANSIKDIEKNEIVNEQVKRIVKPRLSEFLQWMDYSEQEMKKRFEIEKGYLRTEVESLKLYSAWVKPYLRAAEQLRQKGFEGNSALVNAFSTSMFQLTLLGTQESRPPESPKVLKNHKFKRKYHKVFIVDLNFRGHVAQRATQKGDMAFAQGGKVEMKFSSYVLNDEELKLFRKNYDKDNVDDILKITNETESALKALEEDIDHFVFDDKSKKEKEEEEKKKKQGENMNPFSALAEGIAGLFGGGKKKEKKGEEKDISDIKDIKKDDYYEEYVRKDGAGGAKGQLYAVYDVYKKAHGMASSPEEFE